jgi:hypothetical protein
MGLATALLISALAIASSVLIHSATAARPVSTELKGIKDGSTKNLADVSKHKKPFKAPAGFFIQVSDLLSVSPSNQGDVLPVDRLCLHLACMQERASKQLPGPGQHFEFGALKGWEAILDYVKTTPGQ